MRLDLSSIIRQTPAAGVVPTAKSGPNERKLLRYLVQNHFKGCGCVADIGAGTGASTLAMCEGLADNKSVESKAGRIHAFDRFRLDPVFQRSKSPSPEMSFLSEFVRNIADYQEYCVIHEGDICAADADIGPIEILWIDMAKSLSTFQCIADRFYRRLLTGQTLLLQQDFDRPRLPWLHYSSGFLMPYFELVAPAVDSTLLLRLVKDIPGDVIDRVVKDRFTLEEKLHYVQVVRSILQRWPEMDVGQQARFDAILDFAAAYVYYWEGEYREAQQRASELERNEYLRNNYAFMFDEIRSAGTMFQ